MTKNFTICILYGYYCGDYMKEGEIGGAYSAHGIAETCVDFCRILLGKRQEQRLLVRTKLK